MQLSKNSRAGLLALVLGTGLASCGGPPKQADSTVTLPAGAEARDSAKAALTTPALDATSTTADSAAGRSSVTPR